MKGKNKKKEKVKKNSPQSKITILKSIIEETPDFICRFKQNGKLIYANTNFCKYLNRNNENLIDQQIFQLLPIKEKEQIKKIIEKVKKTKKSKFFLSINQSDFKKGKHIKWSVIPILNNKRNVLELQLNGCELTKKEISKKTFKEREKFESALLESERRYKSLVESTSDWIWEIDQNGFYTYSSPKIKNLLGYEPYEIIGLSPFDLMPEEEAERIRGIFNKILKAHKPFNTIENINRCKNGKTIILETSGIPIFDKRRNFIGYRGIDRDISERKKAEEALQISEEKYRSVVETTNEWIWEIDLTGKHTYSNSVVETILGYKPEDLIGKESFELIHEDDLGNVEKTFQNCIEEKKGWRDFIIRWKHKDGSYRYLESNSIPIFDQKNRLLGFRGADRNITERKKMENILRESENKYRKIFENIQDVYYKIDAEGKIIELSPSIKRYTDFESNSLIGKQVEEIYFNPDDRKELLKDIQKKGEVIDYEIRLKNKYNNIVHASLNAHFIYDNDGKFSGIEGTIRDITERKLVEEELKISEANLKKAQKVAHLGSWTWDIKNNKVTWSDEMYFLFGIDPKTFAGNLDEVINNTIFPDDLPKVIESNESVIKHKKPIPLEYRIVLPDGSNRFHENNGFTFDIVVIKVVASTIF